MCLHFLCSHFSLFDLADIKTLGTHNQPRWTLLYTKHEDVQESQFWASSKSLLTPVKIVYLCCTKNQASVHACSHRGPCVTHTVCCLQSIFNVDYRANLSVYIIREPYYVAWTCFMSGHPIVTKVFTHWRLSVKSVCSCFDSRMSRVSKRGEHDTLRMAHKAKVFAFWQGKMWKLRYITRVQIGKQQATIQIYEVNVALPNAPYCHGWASGIETSPRQRDRQSPHVNAGLRESWILASQTNTCFPTSSYSEQHHGPGKSG